MSKKASNNVTRNVSDPFAMLGHFGEAYLKPLATQQEIMFTLAGLLEKVPNTCILFSG